MSQTETQQEQPIKIPCRAIKQRYDVQPFKIGDNDVLFEVSGEVGANIARRLLECFDGALMIVGATKLAIVHVRDVEP